MLHAGKIFSLAGLLVIGMAASVCRPPAGFRIDDSSREAGCGYYSWATVRNQVQERHFPDIQLILDKLATLTSDQRVELESMNSRCQKLCSQAKQELSMQEEQLHNLVLNAPPKAQVLDKVSVRVNAIDKTRQRAILQHRDRFTAAQKLLNASQVRELKKFTRNRDPFPK
jgi:hypothetical protein